LAKGDWIQVVPWGIAVAGLVANHLFSEARERRKEFRSQLDKLIERLTKLEAQGTAFHTAASYDEDTARSIDSEISRIERVATRLTAHAVPTDAIISHRQALTLRNFDSGSFQQQVGASEIVREIEATTVDYEEALEACYRNRYPASFPYYRIVPVDEPGVQALGVAIIASALLAGVWVFLAML
jgi:hypothetical protein